MTSSAVLKNVSNFLKLRFFLMLWISLVAYLFYDSFIYYKTGRQFYYLRLILGLGLCVSRGTATVLNLCSALVLLPLCKKLNLMLYRMLAKLCPGLFFFWLEVAKSFHMTVAVTLLAFAVIHSISHFINLWNFSRHYDDFRKDVNFATHKNENPLKLLASQAGLTGVSMLAITMAMGMMSMKVVRRKFYNLFWYTHQLYVPFMMLLIVHPLGGALKEQKFDEGIDLEIPRNSTATAPKFSAIQSNAWLWMAFPLSCYFLDLLWRILSRNNSKVDIIQASHMAGRTLSLVLRCPNNKFFCRPGQYVLLQSADVSLLEWHPFTVVSVPTPSRRHFTVWIRVKGDWTEGFERVIIEKGLNHVSLLVDGPYSSPMERAICSGVAICVAAGVGITPFVALLQDLVKNPRNRLPKRIHLLWIVKHEQEFTWLAELANKCLLRLRNANRPDRLHLELYVTGQSRVGIDKESAKLAMVNEKGETRLLNSRDEKQLLLTPHVKRKLMVDVAAVGNSDISYCLARDYPLLGCRIRKGRPHWDRVFGYWGHLYPGERVNLFCCGPKNLVHLLRSKCRERYTTTKTKFLFFHERFG